MKNQISNRIETLDWLRGLMALSIMFYHFICFSFAPPDASTLFGRLGIYGVSIFFILSGLSMAIVYNKYIINLKTSVFFFIRRIFRIWPLLWCACIILIVPGLLIGITNWKIFLLNITTLFGFVKPSAYLATGAWSIGNEMVYYFLTPLIIILYNFKKNFGDAFFLVTVLIGIYFSFVILSPNLSLDAQWKLYINPFNNFFLYVMGIAIFYNLRNFKIDNRLNICILLIIILLFAFSPFVGNQISIVTGVGRIFFVILSALLVIGFYKMEIVLPKIIGLPLENFGIATYGVYLMHPIIYFRLIPLLKRFLISNVYLQICIIACLTIILAILSYRIFEIRFIKIGKYLTSIKVKN